MSSLLLKLTVVAVVLAVVLTTPVERERRASVLTKMGRKAGGVFKDVWSFVSGKKSEAKNPERDAVVKQAEAVLSEAQGTISQGKQLIREGKALVAKAAQMKKAHGAQVNKREDGAQVADTDMLEAIDAVKKAGKRSTRTGQKVVFRAGKITRALKEAMMNLTDVVTEGVTEVAAAVADVSDSIDEADQRLKAAKDSSDESDKDGVLGTIQELERTAVLAIEVGKSFEDVSEKSLTLGEKIVKLGLNVIKVVAAAAKNIGKAAGITGRK